MKNTYPKSFGCLYNIMGRNFITPGASGAPQHICDNANALLRAFMDAIGSQESGGIGSPRAERAWEAFENNAVKHLGFGIHSARKFKIAIEEFQREESMFAHRMALADSASRYSDWIKETRAKYAD